MTHKAGAVLIGRNEGERLKRCLASLGNQFDAVVYVDSGSTDGSSKAAKAVGADVVTLDLTKPFTAARARNEGAERLIEIAPHIDAIQFLDGDCELRDGWLQAALGALAGTPELAIVCGRRRERFADATMWNRMVDREWDTPVGPAQACGGDALIRRSAFEDVCGYDSTLIAGEEPEMCFRMRQKGWRIERLDTEMTWHDAALTHWRQWWQRTRRAGYAFAEGAARHGRSPERFRVAQTRRSLIWGAILPVVILLTLVIFGAWALLLLLLYPAQMLRLTLKGMPPESAIFMTLGKFAEAQGALGYWRNALSGKRSRLIEYK